MVFDSILGRSGEDDATADEDPAEAESPSHVCQTCGEEYFGDPSIDIRECRACGGIRVEAVEGRRTGR